MDYAIPTNNAISRLHAEIIAEGDAYYIRAITRRTTLMSTELQLDPTKTRDLPEIRLCWQIRSLIFILALNSGG